MGNPHTSTDKITATRGRTMGRIPRCGIGSVRLCFLHFQLYHAHAIGPADAATTIHNYSILVFFKKINSLYEKDAAYA